MKKVLFVISVIISSAALWAAPIQTVDGGYTASGSLYKVALTADGCIHSLIVGGVEALERVGVNQGGYLTRNDEYAAGDSGKINGNKITFEGKVSRVVYDFEDNFFRVAVTGKGSGDLVYHMTFPKYVMRTPDGRYTQNNIRMETYNTVDMFSGGDYYLTLEGVHTRTDFQGHVVRGADPFGVITVTPKPVTAEERKRCREITLPADKLYSDLNVYSPQDYRVFQRKDRYGGCVTFSGSAPKDADKVEVRLFGNTTTCFVDTQFIEVPFSKVDGSFLYDMFIAPGGWYRAQVRYFRGGKAAKTVTIDHVGMGEVFIGAGQSNSTSCGQYQTKQTSGMVSSFDGKVWRVANDPQLGAQDWCYSCYHGSYYPAFGDAMYKKYGVPIGIVSSGFGATSIEEWQPDAAQKIHDRPQLFKFLSDRINYFGPQGFRAVLWHQGDGDSTRETEDGYIKMKRMIDASRDLAGWYVPWFVAKVSYCNPDYPELPGIRGVHQKLWDTGVALPGPDTDTLRGDMRDNDGQGIHFSPKGLKAHGEMWADAVSRYLDKVL
ncbi:MAG: hypothetical protein J6X38_05100 [Abditibacteriota bacterium]|nr:hypothetical protein [Abditibacteriota bacterium]